MLDARPAPDALARPPLPALATDPPASPARPPAGDALFAAARSLLPILEAGRPLDATTLRDTMTRAFGASDAEGGWVWKDAYEAAEAAVVLFVQRYGRAMRQRAGADADGPRTMLAMLDAVAALEPSHTKRSDEQVRLPAVLDAAALGLCRAQGRRHPAGRHRPGTQRRHRHAGGHGGMRPRQERRRPSASQRIRRDPRPSPDPALPPGRHDRLRRGSHRRPASRRPAHGRHHEPTVLRDAGRRAHPQ